jgi:hypothetical protein
MSLRPTMAVEASSSGLACSWLVDGETCDGGESVTLGEETVFSSLAASEKAEFSKLFSDIVAVNV